ncbi:MAG: hypothetical protein AVDCRST_MAG19-2555, partial [uncultured Thermomicrobiales bacterium]
ATRSRALPDPGRPPHRPARRGPPRRRRRPGRLARGEPVRHPCVRHAERRHAGRGDPGDRGDRGRGGRRHPGFRLRTGDAGDRRRHDGDLDQRRLGRPHRGRRRRRLRLRRIAPGRHLLVRLRGDRQLPLPLRLPPVHEGDGDRRV